MKKTAGQIVDDVVVKLARRAAEEVEYDPNTWAPVLGGLTFGPLGAAAAGGLAAPTGAGSSGAMGAGAGSLLGSLAGAGAGMGLGYAAGGYPGSVVGALGGGLAGSGLGSALGYRSAIDSALAKTSAEEFPMSRGEQTRHELATGLMGAIPYAGGWMQPIYAGAIAPKDRGLGYAGGTLGWGMLGSLPGTAMYLAGHPLIGRGNAALRGVGLGTLLLGQGLGGAYGLHRAIQSDRGEL